MVGLVVKGSLLKGFNSGFTLIKFPCWLITLPGEGLANVDLLGFVVSWCGWLRIVAIEVMMVGILQ